MVGLYRSRGGDTEVSLFGASAKKTPHYAELQAQMATISHNRKLSQHVSQRFEFGVFNSRLRMGTEGGTSSAGATASIIEAAQSITVQNPKRQDDVHQRVGFAAGSGMDLRIHHGDADGDGVAEKGFGFDIGPVSLDVKAERWTDLINMVLPGANSNPIINAIIRDKLEGK